MLPLANKSHLIFIGIAIVSIICFMTIFRMNHEIEFESLISSPTQPQYSFNKGVFIYEKREVDRFRSNAMCISGTRMQRLLDPALFQTLHEHVILTSDPDVFLYGFYSGDLNIDVLFKHFGPNLAGAYLMPDSMAVEVQTGEYQMYTPNWPNYKIAILQGHHFCYQVQLQHYASIIRQAPYEVIMRARPDMFYLTPVNIGSYSTKHLEPTLALYSPPPYDSWGTEYKVPTETGMRSVYVQQTEYGYSNWTYGGTLGITDQCILGSPHSMDLYAHALYLSFGINKNISSAFVEGQLYNTLVEKMKMTSLKADFKYDIRRG